MYIMLLKHSKDSACILVIRIFLVLKSCKSISKIENTKILRQICDLESFTLYQAICANLKKKKAVLHRQLLLYSNLMGRSITS